MAMVKLASTQMHVQWPRAVNIRLAKICRHQTVATKLADSAFATMGSSLMKKLTSVSKSTPVQLLRARRTLGALTSHLQTTAACTDVNVHATNHLLGYLSLWFFLELPSAPLSGYVWFALNALLSPDLAVMA